MPSNLSIMRSDKRIIQGLLLALEPLSNIRGPGRPVSLRLATGFLAVASDEGQGLNEYARRLGIDRSVISRIIHELAERSRDGGPGLGLISIDEGGRPNRQQEIFLTKKGHAVASATQRSLRSLKRSRTSSLNSYLAPTQTGNHRRNDCVAFFGQKNLPTICANRVSFDLDRSKSRFLLPTIADGMKTSRHDCSMNLGRSRIMGDSLSFV
jgi:DNA-binding MarR family transcriptional regulator